MCINENGLCMHANKYLYNNDYENKLEYILHNK